LERTEYRYRPDYVSINQGRPLEEEYYKPDGTRVVITSHIPGSVDSGTAEPSPAPEAAALTEPLKPGDKPPPLNVHTPDMVLEAFMVGLRSENYDDLYERLVSPQQKQRMGEQNGRAEFVKFCETNRRELMASALRLCSSIRAGQSPPMQVSADMTRYRLPDTDRGAFALYGDIPRDLAEHRVEVEGEAEEAFGIAMTGPAIAVRRIRKV
jgi:hypothetical protein